MGRNGSTGLATTNKALRRLGASEVERLRSAGHQLPDETLSLWATALSHRGPLWMLHGQCTFAGADPANADRWDRFRGLAPVAYTGSTTTFVLTGVRA
jgi:hypothetical protein